MESVDDALPIADWLAVLRRRWWIVAVATLVAALTAASVSLGTKPMYEAEARVLVHTRSESVFGGSDDLRAADAARAIQTEIQVFSGERVRARLIDQLPPGMRIPPAIVTAVGNSDVVSVRVRSHDPSTAQLVANEYVRAYSDERGSRRAEQVELAGAQIIDAIDELQAQIETHAVESAAFAALSSQQATLRDTLVQMQIDATLAGDGTSVVRSANLPDAPVEPTPLRTTGLAALVGMLLGLVGVFLIDRLDSRLRTAADLEAITALPVVARIPFARSLAAGPIALSGATEPSTEAFRALRANLAFLFAERRVKMIQLTSALEGEGKTTIAFNLAVLLAESGKRVALVEADLRRPRLAEHLGIPATPGFVEVLTGESIEIAVTPVSIGNSVVHVLPGGREPGNASMMLESERAATVLQRLRSDFDLVVVDSGPVLPRRDCSVLSGVDAVIFVARARSTSQGQVVESLEHLERRDAPVCGVVLNQTRERGEDVPRPTRPDRVANGDTVSTRNISKSDIAI